MKTIFATVLLVSAGFYLAGCESDVAPDPQSKGFSPTAGSLTQPDKSGDPLIQENTRVGN